MATTTKVSVADFRARAARIVELLDTARDALNEALNEADSLYGLAEGRPEAGRFEMFPRFQVEVGSYLKDMVRNLGGNVGDFLDADFDCDRMPQDARDLVDMIDLASTKREPVGADA